MTARELSRLLKRFRKGFKPATLQGKAQGPRRRNPAGINQLHWIKAHQTQQAVIDGRVTMEDFLGNQEVDVVANLGAVEYVP
eukprot:5364348-Amphidinium_carterae.1